MEATMHYDPERHHRKTIRLREYDYRLSRAYFLTICTHERAMLFGEIIGGEMCLSAFGHIALDAWMETAIVRPGVIVDEFIVMPNHIHAIVLLPHHSKATETQTSPSLMRRPRSLSTLVGGFKGTVTKQINARRATPDTPVWQRNFYEHIIRDDEGLRRIREYIAHNPASWESDAENPGNHRNL
jgi:putative transposase